MKKNSQTRTKFLRVTKSGRVDPNPQQTIVLAPYHLHFGPFPAYLKCPSYNRCFVEGQTQPTITWINFHVYKSKVVSKFLT